MPWHIGEQGSHDCDGFPVVKDSDGSVVGCHPTKAKAQAQLAALNINVKERSMGDLPTKGLFRALSPELAHIEVRDGGDASPPIVSVRFAAFNEWTPIESLYEGRFMERFMPGSLDESLAAETPKMLFNHGKDPDLGEKVIASPVTAHVDERFATLEGPLLDGVPPLIVSGLRSGAYGASMQFMAVDQNVDRRAKRSDHNPEGLVERSITKAFVREGGPVTWNAYDGATVAIRSMSDQYRPPDLNLQIAQMAIDHPTQLAQVIERALKPQAEDKPPVATPVQPRFRTREEYLSWLSTT